MRIRNTKLWLISRIGILICFVVMPMQRRCKGPLTDEGFNRLKVPPPEYEIVMWEGVFRAKRVNRHDMLIPFYHDRGTKGDAINRAWSQWAYEHSTTSEK